MDGRERKNVRPGLRVAVVLKHDQSTGRLTRGVVKEVLTKSLPPARSQGQAGDR
jgi:uncharacterized repeat protein (TIGR03833 family)